MTEKGRSAVQSCVYFGKSRQGYYDRIRTDGLRGQFNQMVLEQVESIRETLPKCGTRKLHHLLKADGLKIGRDALFNLLRDTDLLIRRNRRYIKTTDSSDTFLHYRNLLDEMEITHAEDVFVSDITYIRLKGGFCYLAIVADSYTKKIMGKYISRNMQTPLVLKALVQSLKNKQYNRKLIHHSDHGSQYSSRTYTNALKLSDIMISMAGRGRAWENPVAERIMGILKQEFSLNRTFDTYEEAYDQVEAAIDKYNKIRPHLSCGYLTPEQAHDQGENLINVWKKEKLSTFPHGRQQLL